jgi:hypothetical protein
MKKLTLTLVALLSQSPSLYASVTDATAFSWIASGNLPGVESVQNTFGNHSFGSGLTTIGADAAGTPVIKFSGVSGNTNALQPSVRASLGYYWKVSSNTGSTDPVLMHFSTSGYVDSTYGFSVNNPTPGAIYSSLNTVDVGIKATFFTAYNQTRTYGATIGDYVLNWAQGTNVISNGSGSGYVTDGGSKTGHGEFSQTFDIWATPNVENVIVLEVAGSLNDSYGSLKQIATEYFSFNGFIDPIITIDAAQAGNYSLEVSAIPVAAVPIPAAGWLFGSALIGLLTAARRRALV